MKASLTLVLQGRIGPYQVIADTALEELADRLRSIEAPEVPFRLPTGTLEPAMIDPSTVTIKQLGDGRQALVAEVEIPDEMGGELPPLVAAKSGLEATEDERRKAMPILEAQLQDPENVQTV